MVINQGEIEEDIRLATGGADTLYAHALHESGKLVHVIIAGDRCIC